MKRITAAIVGLGLFGALTGPAISGGAGVAYTDFANIFTSNQRINAGLGVNVAPGATGTISASVNYFERGRAAAIGEWTDVAYSAGNFTVPAACVSPGCSWTVNSGMQTTYRYALVGKTMLLIVRLDGTTIVGSPASLRVAVPGGYTIQGTVDALYIPQVNAVYNTAAYEAGAGRTSVWFYTTVGFAGWTASAVNNSIIVTAIFEVQ